MKKKRKALLVMRSIASLNNMNIPSKLIDKTNKCILCDQISNAKKGPEVRVEAGFCFMSV